MTKKKVSLKTIWRDYMGDGLEVFDIAGLSGRAAVLGVFKSLNL